MIKAYIISFLFAAAVYVGAFFLFQQLDYFKQTDAETGNRVPNMLMVSVYSAYAAFPVLFLSLLIFYIKARGQARKTPVYNMCHLKPNIIPQDIPSGNFL